MTSLAASFQLCPIKLTYFGSRLSSGSSKLENTVPVPSAKPTGRGQGRADPVSHIHREGRLCLIGRLGEARCRSGGWGSQRSSAKRLTSSSGAHSRRLSSPRSELVSSTRGRSLAHARDEYRSPPLEKDSSRGDLATAVSTSHLRPHRRQILRAHLSKAVAAGAARRPQYPASTWPRAARPSQQAPLP